MALLVWAALRTTILQWGEGVVEHKVYLIGNIDVHMVLACYLIMYVYSIVNSFQIDQHAYHDCAIGPSTQATAGLAHFCNIWWPSS